MSSVAKAVLTDKLSFFLRSKLVLQFGFLVLVEREFNFRDCWLASEQEECRHYCCNGSHDSTNNTTDGPWTRPIRGILSFPLIGSVSTSIVLRKFWGVGGWLWGDWLCSGNHDGTWLWLVFVSRWGWFGFLWGWLGFFWVRFGILGNFWLRSWLLWEVIFWDGKHARKSGSRHWCTECRDIEAVADIRVVARGHRSKAASRKAIMWRNESLRLQRPSEIKRSRRLEVHGRCDRKVEVLVYSTSQVQLNAVAIEAAVRDRVKMILPGVEPVDFNGRNGCPSGRCEIGRAHV
jgi:hypothetical protein